MKYLANDYVAKDGDSTTKRSKMQFYTKNRNGQFELFPKEKTSAFRLFALPILAIGLIVALLFTLPSIGEEVSTMKGLLCSTPEQVETVMSSPDRLKALAEVNTPEAVCSVFIYAGVEGDTAQTIDTLEGKTDIKAVAVIAFSPDGVKWVQLQEPQIQFGPFLQQKVKPVGIQT